MKVYTKKSLVKSFIFGVVVGTLLVTVGLFTTGHLALDTSTHTEEVQYTYTTYDGFSFK